MLARTLLSPRTLRYGRDPAQQADLHMPDAVTTRLPVVCLLHGGFWRMPHGREQWHAVIPALLARGVAVWNIGYRRAGVPEGAWPAALEDVAAAIEALGDLAESEQGIDPSRVITVGHSAGGHLALWAAARRRPERFGASGRIRPCAAAGLAPAADLVQVHVLGCGAGAVENWIGGPPEQYPDRYANASPGALLPLGIPQLIVHGAKDEALPVSLSREYVACARSRGDEVEYREPEHGTHMDFLDPDSSSFALLCDWLASVSARVVAND